MSNLIKSSSVISLDQLKRLQSASHHREITPSYSEEDGLLAEPQPDEETISLRDQILADAQAFADERLQEASRECEKMLTEASAQIDVWWLEKRSEDDAAFEQARTSGYEQGFQEGAAAAEEKLRQQWQQDLDAASDALRGAYAMREQIIQEAEPFLVELSCAIAEKIIGQQLSHAPEMALELIVKSLSRRREQGVITLCVSPQQLPFVQAAREELNMAIDSQAELQILPDSTVKDNGCVIRSAFGSIDARIDTQLEEIKRELIQLAHQSNEERSHNADWNQA
ncbi:FliH/SctL family protein [Paenibacillus sp. CAU 1782]